MPLPPQSAKSASSGGGHVAFEQAQVLPVHEQVSSSYRQVKNVFPQAWLVAGFVAGQAPQDHIGNGSSAHVQVSPPYAHSNGSTPLLVLQASPIRGCVAGHAVQSQLPFVHWHV